MRYKVGKTYYIGYWNTTLTVLEIIPNDIWGEEYKCLWKDGRVTIHCTKLDPDKDYEIKSA